MAQAPTRTTTKTEKLRVGGMDCADCAQSIATSLQQMPGVTTADVSFGAATAKVSFEPQKISHEAIAHRIASLGYTVEEDASASKSMQFTIEGMDCADCALTVEKAVNALQGVSKAEVNFNTARLLVTPSGDRADLKDAIERKVGAAGYRAVPAGERSAAREKFWKRERRVITSAAGAIFLLLGWAASTFGLPAPVPTMLFAGTLLVSGLGFARAGLLALASGRADMNLLMTVAAIGAAAIGDWAEAATVVMLFAVGGTLQAFTLDKTRNAVRSLMQLAPPMATLRRTDTGGGLRVFRDVRVPVEEIEPGQIVLIAPGERIPLDGTVVEGASSVDQSPITGESVPVDVEVGSSVYAGTINGPGAFGIEVEHASEDTTLSRIITMVEDAQASKAPSQQFVDRFASYYTPVVIAGAVLVSAVPPLLFGQSFLEWFYRALVLLVVACPCALVISTPVSIVAAIGAATRNGVLVKGGATLEALGKVRSIAFDKTGTLTEGRPHVVSVFALSGDSNTLLDMAASVEARSEHPLAKAIVHHMRSGNRTRGPEATGYTAVPGKGAYADLNGERIYAGNERLFSENGILLGPIRNTLDELYRAGNTAIIVGTSKAVLGAIGLADAPRAEAANSVSDLKRIGVAHVGMLTGDNERTAAQISERLGVDGYDANLLPSDKVEAVRRMAKEHGSVAMVGDGVNDAPAMAAADVGIAMGTAGTDAALEVADVALMSDDLSRLRYAVLLSRETLRVVKQNIGVSIGVKVLALGLAAIGALPLWGAILADMGVSLLVTLNGMRLLAYNKEK